MANNKLSHVHASAGYSGKRWDCNLGHNLSFTSASTDATFAVAKTITLAAGTFPAWLTIGKVFTTNSLLNPGPFTVMDNTTPNVITVLETVVAEAGVTVTLEGSEDTGIQSTLLKNLAPLATAYLTEDTPHLVVSNGALGGNRILDISGMEVESAARGGKALDGRFMHLSVMNTDVDNTGFGVTLTVKASGLINGAATFVITTPNDYWFEHDQNGNWIVTVMPSPSDKVAVVKRVPFIAAKWGEHPTNKNTIVVLQTGVPGVGQIGPHSLANYDSYLAQVWNADYSTFTELTECELKVDKTTGNITMQKAQGAQPFNGEIIISGTLD